VENSGEKRWRLIDIASTEQGEHVVRVHYKQFSGRGGYFGFEDGQHIRAGSARLQ